jgi:hypothetical protein
MAILSGINEYGRSWALRVAILGAMLIPLSLPSSSTAADDGDFAVVSRDRCPVPVHSSTSASGLTAYSMVPQQMAAVGQGVTIEKLVEQCTGIPADDQLTVLVPGVHSSGTPFTMTAVGPVPADMVRDYPWLKGKQLRVKVVSVRASSSKR